MIVQVLNNRLAQLLIVLLVGLGSGAALLNHFSPRVVTYPTIENVKTVVVEKPVLTERTVTKIITDPKERVLIEQLIKENEALNLQVLELTTTIAHLRSRGGTEKDGVITPEPEVPGEEAKFTYKDYQLEATYNSRLFDYTLNQKFIIQTSTARSKDGVLSSRVNLFQDTPEGLINVPTKTTAIFADERVSRFRVSPRVQAGVSINEKNEKSGVVALQWLKRGKSTAPEDIRFSLASPVFMVTGDKTWSAGILPISFNLGSLPKQPFTNLWISPSVDIHKKLGVSITATF